MLVLLRPATSRPCDVMTLATRRAVWKQCRTISSLQSKQWRTGASLPRTVSSPHCGPSGTNGVTCCARARCHGFYRQQRKLWFPVTRLVSNWACAQRLNRTNGAVDKNKVLDRENFPGTFKPLCNVQLRRSLHCHIGLPSGISQLQRTSGDSQSDARIQRVSGHVTRSMRRRYCAQAGSGSELSMQNPLLRDYAKHLHDKFREASDFLTEGGGGGVLVKNRVSRIAFSSEDVLVRVLFTQSAAGERPV